MRTTSWLGLTLKQVVEVSAAIHPDWDAKEHAHYLITEEGFDDTYVSGQHSAIIAIMLRNRQRIASAGR